MTSSDGFCSTLTFASGELGTQHIRSSDSLVNRPNTAITGTPNRPHLHARTSSTHSNSGYAIPQSPMAHASTPISSALSFSGRPHSPTRSNSTSSIATQPSITQHGQLGSVVSNPTLITGAVPSITATGSSCAIPGVRDVATPPQTPRSAASSVSGIKRDASESEKEDTSSGIQEQNQGQAKKRRIAPTLVQR